MPQPSVIYEELPGHSRQPITGRRGRLATLPNNTAVKIQI